MTAYCVLFALPAIACYFIISLAEVNIGDFLGAPVLTTDNEMLMGLTLFLLAYAGFQRYGRTVLAIPPRTHSLVDRERLIYAIFFASFAIDLVFFFAFGLGKAGTENPTSLSFISTLMPKDIALMLVLQINSHQPKRVLLVMAGFTAFALSLGWTGQFFTLFIVSLYLFRNWLRHRKMLVVAILLVGIAVYPAIFSVKLGVRQGEAFDYNALTVIHLASRLTGYPALIQMHGELSNFIAGYSGYFDSFSYVIEPLLAIIPKSILGLQGSTTLEKAIVEYSGGNPDLTQFIWGLPTKIWFYWHVSPLHFIVFCLENAVLFWAAYRWARSRRDEFLSFYLVFLLGMYVWAGDISTLFVSLFRIAVFIALYTILDAAFPRHPQRGAPGRITAPATAAE